MRNRRSGRQRARILRPRRRSISALAAPAIVAILALAPLSGGFGSSHAAAATSLTDLPLRVTLTSLTPVAPQPGDTLVVSGTLTNLTDLPISNINYELKASASSVLSRSEFDDYAADPDGPLDLSYGTPIVAGDPSTLAPGASEPFSVSVPHVDTTFALPLNWAVRELGISVTGSDTLGPDVIIGQLRTFLPWAPRAAIGTGYPAQLAWVWPLVDRPHRALDGTWYDDSLAPELTGTGRLAGLLNAGVDAQIQRGPGKHPTTVDVPVTWAIDPLLISDVQAMTAGYRVKPAAGTSSSSTATTVGVGTNAAKTWLALLHTALGQPGAAVLPLPYADPDVTAAVRGGFSTAVGLATASSQQAFTSAFGDAVELLHIGWPADGLADARAVNELVASGDGGVLLSTAAVPLVPPLPSATPTAHTTINTNTNTNIPALLTDAGLDSDVMSGIDNPNGQRLSLQQFLSETLMFQLERPSDQRDVIVAPSRHWNPSPSYAAALLADTGKLPWVQPASLDQVSSSPIDAVPRAPLTYPASARHDELSPSYVASLRELRSEINDFNSILPDGTSAIIRFTNAEHEALSTAWRTRPQLASQRLAELSDTVKTAMSQVHITSHVNSYVTLTSHGGKVPITVANDSDSAVKVTVQLVANQRLALANHGRVLVTIPAHQQDRVDIHATAKTSGVFPLQVQLLTPTSPRHKYGDSVQLFVRSTVYGTITLVITGAATAALLIAVAIRLTRRGFAARRGSKAAAT